MNEHKFTADMAWPEPPRSSTYWFASVQRAQSRWHRYETIASGPLTAAGVTAADIEQSEGSTRRREPWRAYFRRILTQPVF